MLKSQLPSACSVKFKFLFSLNLVVLDFKKQTFQLQLEGQRNGETISLKTCKYNYEILVQSVS